MGIKQQRSFPIELWNLQNSHWTILKLALNCNGECGKPTWLYRCMSKDGWWMGSVRSAMKTEKNGELLGPQVWGSHQHYLGFAELNIQFPWLALPPGAWGTSSYNYKTLIVTSSSSFHSVLSWKVPDKCGSYRIWILRNQAHREQMPRAGRPMCSRWADISVLVMISKLPVCSPSKSLWVCQCEFASQSQVPFKLFKGRFLCPWGREADPLLGQCLWASQQRPDSRHGTSSWAPESMQASTVPSSGDQNTFS